MTEAKLKEVLERHQQWLNAKEGGIRANLRSANLHDADLHDADLSGANLSSANLRSADLSRTNLRSAVNFINVYFERADDGYIAYKTFGGTYTPPKDWEIKPGSVISETVNFDRCTECGSGINVAPLEWVKRKYGGKEIWKVLIRWEWLAGVCVPYNSDGKIRCERVELLEVVE